MAPLKAPPIQPGTANQPQIDFVRLAQLAKAAGNAYEPTSVIEAGYGKANVIARDLSESNGRYFIHFNHADRTQTIAIRGSVNKQNAWVDVDSLKVFDPRLKMFLHTGFKPARRLRCTPTGNGHTPQRTSPGISSPTTIGNRSTSKTLLITKSRTTSTASWL